MLVALKSNQGFLSLIGQDKIPFDDVIYLKKKYLCSGYLIHGVTKYLANLLWFVPPQVTFTCLLEVTPRILMTFRGTHNPRPGGTFSNQVGVFCLLPPP